MGTGKFYDSELQCKVQVEIVDLCKYPQEKEQIGLRIENNVTFKFSCFVEKFNIYCH